MGVPAREAAQRACLGPTSRRGACVSCAQIESIKTMGLACGTVVLVVLASNETLLPVILLTFPRFFEQSVSSACYEAVARAGAVVCCCGCCRARSRK